MIEIFDARRTRSFGCFASFKAATDTLDALAAGGQLGGIPAVSVSQYRNGELQREYKAARCADKWRIPHIRKRKMQLPEDGGKRRKRKWRKEYPTPEHCFREGFPDWMNRSYPVPYDDRLRQCNRQCRAYAK